MKESRLKVLFQHVPIYKKRNGKWEIQVFTYKQGLIEDQKYELKIQSSRWSMIYGTGISFKLIEINEIWLIYYRGFVSHWRTSFWSEERLENDGELMPCGRVIKNRGLLPGELVKQCQFVLMTNINNFKKYGLGNTMLFSNIARYIQMSSYRSVLMWSVWILKLILKRLGSMKILAGVWLMTTI